MASHRFGPALPRTKVDETDSAACKAHYVLCTCSRNMAGHLVGAVATPAFYLMRPGPRGSNSAVPSLASNADARLLILVDGPRVSDCEHKGSA